MTDFAALAANLLSKLGTTVTIKRTTGESINPVTGAVTAGTTNTYIVNGAWLKTASLIMGDGSSVTGARIETDKKTLVIDATQTPLLTDKIAVAGEDWIIESIDLRQQADNRIVYFLTVHK